MITWNQINLQDRASFMIEEFLFFHDFIIIILISIIIFVGTIIIYRIFNSFINMFLLENQLLEIIWTIIPGIILIEIALPSLSLLYLFEESFNSNITIKALGHQWFWRYEYWDFLKNNEGFAFDSYMIPADSEQSSYLRLLDVDSRLILPYGRKTRILVSSVDVLHAWTVPRIGIKADATPGRLNQLSFTPNRTGVFFGQCSEICGANHRFIPIVLEVINLSDFIKWIKTLCLYSLYKALFWRDKKESFSLGTFSYSDI